MLEGIRSNQIIVGAYSTRDGICPMLAAHRGGGRTTCIAFARAWDRFALGGKRAKPRRATERELLILATQLEASLLAEDRPFTGSGPGADSGSALAAAIAEHRELVAKRPAVLEADQPTPERPGDPNRTPELRGRRGWAWSRAFRRYDEFESALELLHAEAHAHRDRAAV